MGSPVPGPPERRARVLVADDEPALRDAYREALERAGHDVDLAHDGTTAAALVRENAYDAIVSDISMPGMDGIQLLRAVRERDLDVPVVLVTGDPTLETALRAVEYGALRYLVKPIHLREFEQVIDHALRLHRLAVLKREAVAALGMEGWQIGDRAGLEAAFARALATLRMAYQPIVSWSRRSVLGREALVRPREPALPSPPALFTAAERLGRLTELGRAIRELVASDLSATAGPATPGDAPGDELRFVNLHPFDLLDDALYSPRSPLSGHAGRVVLEITERASLDGVKDVRARIAALRKMGYRLALDDMGAGYAGLTTFTLLEPEIVKLDLALVRDLHREPTKQKVVQSMTALCREMGLLVIAEGVETAEERDEIVRLGGDLLQGYLFARPGAPDAPVAW